ncbi:ACTF [Mytilus coruscus]|uniref:ACTF n=1 Tax=Mytilus coruscus TaxID=42192 RepID=A0A6J8EN89_MYTCO|nr:ACTF [Mytilus coruscus]
MLEIGDGVTHIVPICEGYCIQPAIKRLDLGGRDLTSYLQTLLHEKGHDFVTTGNFEIVREMKEQLCYVAEDYSKEISLSKCSNDVDSSYELPDGNVITIGKERIQCPEILFRPSKDLGSDGIHKLLYDSIMAIDMDWRKHYYINIVISGGSTMFSGYERGRICKAFGYRICSFDSRTNVEKMLLPLQKGKIPPELVDIFLLHYLHFNPCGSQMQSTKNMYPILSTENAQIAKTFLA